MPVRLFTVILYTRYIYTNYISLMPCIQKEGDVFRLRVLFVSLLLTLVLYHKEVTSACVAMQWCPVICTPHLLISPLLTEIPHHKEVTPLYCPVQWSIATPIFLQIYLRSLQCSLHNVPLSIFVGLKKASAMRIVLRFDCFILGVSQVQLPAPHIDISH